MTFRSRRPEHLPPILCIHTYIMIFSSMYVWNKRTVSRDTADACYSGTISWKHTIKTVPATVRRELSAFRFIFFPCANTKTATMANRTSPLPRIPGFYQSFTVSLMCFSKPGRFSRKQSTRRVPTLGVAAGRCVRFRLSREGARRFTFFQPT